MTDYRKLVAKTSEADRTHVVRCADDGVRASLATFQDPGETKVSQLDVAVVVEEDVGRLDVAMQHCSVAQVRVACLQSTAGLVQHAPNKHFLNPLSCPTKTN